MRSDSTHRQAREGGTAATCASALALGRTLPRLLLAASLCAFAASEASAQYSCIVTAGARTFDLTELDGDSRVLRFRSDEASTRNWVYLFSACGNVSPPASCGSAPRSAALQETDNSCYGLGKFVTRTVTEKATGVDLFFLSTVMMGALQSSRLNAQTRCAH
jgi:hypothetical protein